jgi:GDP-L-fucose synthase
MQFHQRNAHQSHGPNDNYHPENSHVLPALIRRFHEARRDGLGEVTIWGTGTPRREFLHVDDLADACLFLMDTFNEPGFVNIGTGTDLFYPGTGTDDCPYRRF